MAKMGEKALSNAIRQGADEIRAVLYPQTQQVVAPAAPQPSYDPAQSSRSVSQDHGKSIEH